VYIRFDLELPLLTSTRQPPVAGKVRRDKVNSRDRMSSPSSADSERHPVRFEVFTIRLGQKQLERQDNLFLAGRSTFLHVVYRMQGRPAASHKPPKHSGRSCFWLGDLVGWRSSYGGGRCRATLTRLSLSGSGLNINESAFRCSDLLPCRTLIQYHAASCGTSCIRKLKFPMFLAIELSI
jgi:hypothetical protein